MRKGRSLGASCFGRFSPAELPASGPHFPLNTPPKQSFFQTFPCCLTLTSSGPRDKPNSPKSYNGVPKKLSSPPPPQTISDQRVGYGRTWSGKLTVIPSRLLLCGVTESARERHPPLRVLETELEEGAGPEQGHHGRKRYKPLTLADREVESGDFGGHGGQWGAGRD